MTFDRIGRRHDVADLEVEEATLDDVCRKVWQYARPKLGSHEVEVEVDLQKRTGTIVVGGARMAGTFTIEPNLPDGVKPHPYVIGYAADDQVPWVNELVPMGMLQGFVVGHCGHRVAQTEWRAGFRVCEHCPRVES